MEQAFDIDFVLDGTHYQAGVTVLKGKDHVQYTIAPTDEALQLRYGNQVVHEFPGQPLEFAFPVNAGHQQSYNKAVGEALRRVLDKK